jgi:hypothetical protein
VGRCTGRYCGAMQRGVHANAAIGDGLADDDVRKEGKQRSDQRAESAERVPRMRRCSASFERLSVSSFIHVGQDRDVRPSRKRFGCLPHPAKTLRPTSRWAERQAVATR